MGSGCVLTALATVFAAAHLPFRPPPLADLAQDEHKGQALADTVQSGGKD